LAFDVPAAARDPDDLAALGRAGFHVATLAGNHIFDFGREGIADTIAALDAAAIASCGAGMDVAASAHASLVERHATRIGILSYNCVGRASPWAYATKAAGAHVRIVDRDGADFSGQRRRRAPTLRGPSVGRVDAAGHRAIAAAGGTC